MISTVLPSYLLQLYWMRLNCRRKKDRCVLLSTVAPPPWPAWNSMFRWVQNLPTSWYSIKTGILYKGRPDIEPLAHVLRGWKVQVIRPGKSNERCWCFVGLSVGNSVTPDMIKSMVRHPIVLPWPIPTRRSLYETAVAVRKDIIMATGRSDYPNQVNNVLGFLYIFRGALDVPGTPDQWTHETGCCKALAELTKISRAGYRYTGLNERICLSAPITSFQTSWSKIVATVAPAAAKAAIESGVSRVNIEDWDAYTIELNKRLGLDNQLSRVIGNKARRDPKRVVLQMPKTSRY